MKLIWQLAMICGVCLAGEAISLALPFTCPGGIMSMVILFVLLAVKAIREEQIKSVTDFLLDNMSFFYIPVSVGMLEYFDIISQNLVAILVICLTSLVVTLIVTYYTVMLVNRLLKGGKE